MRAAAVLALVLSFVTPPVVWGSAPEVSAKAGAASLAAPSSAACALVRNAAKAEKTWSSDTAATSDRQAHHPAQTSAIAHVVRASSLSHSNLDAPPLAPRPPPLGH